MTCSLALHGLEHDKELASCTPRRWMLAFNVSHTQDPRVCHYDCQPDSIGERPHARGSQRGYLLTGLHPPARACLANVSYRLHAASTRRNVYCVMGCMTTMHAQCISFFCTNVGVKSRAHLAATASACVRWAEAWKLHLGRQGHGCCACSSKAWLSVCGRTGKLHAHHAWWFPKA